MTPYPDENGRPDTTATPPRRFAAARLGAVLSPLLGLAAVLLVLALWLWALLGVVAVAVGLLSLRRLNAEGDDYSSGEGAPRRPAPNRPARALTVAGMALGGAAVVVGVVELVSVVLLRAVETSRRAECANNLRQIGMAATLYHDFNENLYPAATVDLPDGLAGLAPWLAVPHEERLSWLVVILPYLERNAPSPGPPPAGEKPRQRPRDPFLSQLYRKFNLVRPWDAAANAEAADTFLRFYVCPSHPRYDTGRKPAPTHYVGIAGIGPEAARLPIPSPRAGFFGYGRHVWLEGSGRGNLPAGTSHTMMATETARANGPWAAGGRPTLRPLLPGEKPYVGRGGQFGGIHPGGANVLLVDLSVRFFTKDGDPDLFERLATLADEP